MRRLIAIVTMALMSTGLLAVTATPAHAAGELWAVNAVSAVGCADNSIKLATHTSGLTGVGYITHTRAYSGGLQYMNEDAGNLNNDTDYDWTIYADETYGPSTSPVGTWPIPAGQRIDLYLELERPKGTVLSSWHVVIDGCDTKNVLFLGPTSTDTDGDFIATPADKCPALAGVGRVNGCPLFARTVKLKYKASKDRFDGKVKSSSLNWTASQKVTLFKKVPGKDKRLGKTRSGTSGKFSFDYDASPGKYYVVLKAKVTPTQGEVTAVKKLIKVG